MSQYQFDQIFIFYIFYCNLKGKDRKKKKKEKEMFICEISYYFDLPKIRVGRARATKNYVAFA